MNELTLAFWRHAEGYYRRADGTPAAELDNLRLALLPLKHLYGTSPARNFGSMALNAVRQRMVDAGLCRRTINLRTARLVWVFRFGVENELLSATVYHALKAVGGLRIGGSAGREGRNVSPVPDAFVDAVRPHVSRQLWAVISLQRLTGMRSGRC